MKRTSGNGTSNRQTLYLLGNAPYIFLVKIGISGKSSRRVKEVSASVPGTCFCIFSVDLPFAWQFEQALHRGLFFLNVRFGGSKEWYFFPAAFVAFPVMVFLKVAEWALWIIGALVALWLLCGQPGEPVRALGRMLERLL
jgi:hypothetical protein